MFCESIVTFLGNLNTVFALIKECKITKYICTPKTQLSFFNKLCSWNNLITNTMKGEASDANAKSVKNCMI